MQNSRLKRFFEARAKALEEEREICSFMHEGGEENGNILPPIVDRKISRVDAINFNRQAEGDEACGTMVEVTDNVNFEATEGQAAEAEKKASDLHTPQKQVEMTPMKTPDTTAVKTKLIDDKDKKEEEKSEEQKKKEEEEENERKKLVNERAKMLINKYVKDNCCLMIVALILSAAGLLSNITTPWFIGQVVEAITQKNWDRINQLAYIWFGITIVGAIFSYIQNWLFGIISNKIGQQLRQDLYEQILSKDVEFFDSRKTGDLISRLQADTEKIQGILSTQSTMLINNLLFLIMTVVIFFITSWEMTLFTIGVMLPILCFGPIYGRFMRVVNKDVSDAKARLTEIAEETFSNVRTVKAFSTEDHETVRYFEHNEAVYNNEFRGGIAYGFFQMFMTFTMFGTLTALIYFAAYLNRIDKLTIGEFTSFQFYMFSFLINFMGVANIVGEVIGVYGTMEGIAEITMYEPKIPIEGGDEISTAALSDGKISLTDIEFTYPTKTDIKVIDKVNIEVAKNKTVALVGSSGCGKSTIIQLVERFYDPHVGSVQYGGQDLTNVDPESYKSHIAIVQQEPVLFSGSIRENITYGINQEVTDEVIDDACRQANALAFVKDEKLFPDGYDTLVGERGVKLSGGQKQRVAIARALIRKPKVLLLDEATSALDAESEHQVQQALDSVLQNPDLTQTVIVIAHRLSTVKGADEIIVLKKGIIAERGTHDELVALGGQYRALVERQLMSADQP